MLQPSSHYRLTASPERTQDGIKRTAKPSAPAAMPLTKVHPEETQDGKTGYWLQIADVHIKGMISMNPDT